MKETIGFIGAGNMAAAIIGGLCDAGYAPELITVYDLHHEKLNALSDAHGVRKASSLNQLMVESDVVVLAVKPQSLQAVIGELKADARPEQLWLSVAAGIEVGSIQSWLGEDFPVVRTMPNTPALVRAGATGLFASPQVSSDQQQTAESIMRSVGLTLWVPEERLLEAVTAVSGSGPAYFFYQIEALQAAGEALGLGAKESELLAVQTAFGAAKLALESDLSAATLREKVSSPDGATLAALQVMKESGYEDIILNAAKACAARAREMGEAAKANDSLTNGKPS